MAHFQKLRYQFHSEYGIVALSLWRQALHTTAGGWPHFPEGDEADAIYRNVPYRPQDRYAKFRGKKQEPPPWPVTVLN